MKPQVIKKVISLPIYNIEVVLYKKGGTISSKLFSVCPYCDAGDCDMDCPSAMEKASDRDPDVVQKHLTEVADFVCHNTAMDAVTSLILAHAVAGIDIESKGYLDGIDAAVSSVENNL